MQTSSKSYTCEAEIVYGKNIENNIYDYAENHNRHRCHLLRHRSSRRAYHLYFHFQDREQP